MSSTVTPSSQETAANHRSISWGDAVAREKSVFSFADSMQSVRSIAASSATDTETQASSTASCCSDPRITNNQPNGNLVSDKRRRQRRLPPFAFRKNYSKGLKPLQEPHLILHIPEDTVGEEDDGEVDEKSDKFDCLPHEEAYNHQHEQALRHSSLTSIESFTSSQETPRISNSSVAHIFRGGPKDQVGVLVTFQGSSIEDASNLKMNNEQARFETPSARAFTQLPFFFNTTHTMTQSSPRCVIDDEPNFENDDFYSNLGKIYQSQPGVVGTTTTESSSRQMLHKWRRWKWVPITAFLLLVTVIAIAVLLTLRPSSSATSNNVTMNNTSSVTMRPTTPSRSRSPTPHPSLGNSSNVTNSTSAPSTMIRPSNAPTKHNLSLTAHVPNHHGLKNSSAAVPTTTVRTTEAPTAHRLSISRLSSLKNILNEHSDQKGSPQYQALNWMANTDKTPLTLPPNVIRQRYVLAVLYFATNPTKWSSRFRFLSPNSTCFWNDGQNGVFCDQSNTSATHLILQSNNLRGAIPSEIGGLTDLQELDFADNGLVGTIPTILGQLSKLVSLFINSNNLTGTIPSVILNLSNLKSLRVGSNNLTGTLPSGLERLTKIVELDVSQNRINGTIPRELGRLLNLSLFAAYNNHLSGSLPSEIESLQRITTLDIHNNLLIGTIPTSIQRMVNLSFLSLQGNILTGNLDWLTQQGIQKPVWRNLSVLHLNENQLTGTIPDRIVLISQLVDLRLSENRFHGTIPTELEKLLHLETLNLSKNGFSGSLPSSFGTFANLTWLDVGSNHLSGSLVTDFSKEMHLSYLGFDRNKFNGTVPLSLANIHSLRSLRLEFNKFSGDLSQFCNSTNALFDVWADCALNCSCCAKCCRENKCMTSLKH